MSGPHVLTPPKIQSYHILPTGGTGGKYEQEWADFVQSATPQGQSERVIYAVELFLILDYPIYKGWDIDISKTMSDEHI